MQEEKLFTEIDKLSDFGDDPPVQDKVSEKNIIIPLSIKCLLLFILFHPKSETILNKFFVQSNFNTLLRLTCKIVFFIGVDYILEKNFNQK